MSSSLIILLFLLVVIIAIILPFIPLKLFFDAKSAGIKIEITDLISMRIRKCNPYEIVNTAILLKKSGIDIDLASLESLYLGGGHCLLVAQAMILAKENNIEVSFKNLVAIDLAGRNPVRCLKDCIPEHILNSNTETFKSKEGKEYNVSFTLKAKLNINKMVGGCCGGEEELLNSIFGYIEERITTSDGLIGINPTDLSKVILKEDFSKDCVFDIKEIKININ